MKLRKYRKLQGTYQVIFLSFAGVKQNNYEDTIARIKKYYYVNKKHYAPF